MFQNQDFAYLNWTYFGCYYYILRIVAQKSWFYEEKNHFPLQYTLQKQAGENLKESPKNGVQFASMSKTEYWLNRYENRSVEPMLTTPNINRSRMQIPDASFRLQFNSQFTFKDAEEVIDYLHTMAYHIFILHPF
jgi:hypothetical protein